MVGKEDYYYISLDSQAGDQLEGNQGHFSWNLDRALPKGASISLCQFNFSTTSTTGFGQSGMNGVLVISENLGPRNQSYVSRFSSTASKPVPTCLLAQIPNQSIYTPDGSEILLGSYGPYNPITVELSPHSEIYEVRLKLTEPDGNVTISDIEDDLDWSVLLKIQY